MTPSVASKTGEVISKPLSLQREEVKVDGSRVSKMLTLNVGFFKP